MELYIRKKQNYLKIELVLVNNKIKKMYSVKEIEQIVLDNRNDLIDNTFCYKLFEKRVFDNFLLEELIFNINKLIEYYRSNIKLINKNILKSILWITQSIFKVVIYHFDSFDLSKINDFKIEEWSNSYMDQLNDIFNQTLKLI